jgi:CubicO group peptidase (beta-lactamase class C family)
MSMGGEVLRADVTLGTAARWLGVLVCLLAAGCSDTQAAPSDDAVIEADDPSESAPADAGLAPPTSSGESTPAELDVAALLEPIRATSDVPALGALMLSRDGEIALGATGVRRRGDLTPVTALDRWHLGSDTKAMTAVLLARLVERGLLEFDTPLGQLLPAGEAMDAAYAAMPLSQLLTHRSGMGDVAEYPELWLALFTATDALPEQRARFASQVLAVAPPGPVGEFHYSNSNYMVAGAVLERLMGRSWEALMQEELFTPLDMSSCGFGPPGDAAASPVDEPWGHDGATPLPPGPRADNPAALGPAGTVHCTLSDWGKFIALFLGARSDYLTAASLARLTTPAPGADYALGWISVETPLGRALSHAGSNTFWFADAWVFPDRNRAYLTVTNCGDMGACLGAVDAAVGALLQAEGG